MLTTAGCGDEQKPTLQPPTTNGGGGALTDWSSLGVNTVSSGSTTSAVKHDDYLVGSHSGYICSDCHAQTQTDPTTGALVDVARDKICSHCHQYSKYTSIMTNVNHATLKAGDHCNACHYSAAGVSGSNISGWRWSSVPSPKTRVPHTQWHYNVKGACLNCHTASNETIPTNHPAITSTTACENCHYYNNGRWAGQHQPYTTGCRAIGCHTGHYDPYNCEWCHLDAASGGYTTWKMSFGGSHQSVFDRRSCSACHGGAGGGE